MLLEEQERLQEEQDRLQDEQGRCRTSRIGCMMCRVGVGAEYFDILPIRHKVHVPRRY